MPPCLKSNLGIATVLVSSFPFSLPAEVILLDETFSYADGDIVGNGSWNNPTSTGNLTVAAGFLAVPGAAGEYSSEIGFSRAGHENDAIELTLDASSSTNNNAITILDPANRSVIVSWAFADNPTNGTGWVFNGEQSGITGTVQLAATIDPGTNTVFGQLFDGSTNSLLFTSSTHAITQSQLDNSTTVYLYGDSRGQPSDATWDNLRLAAVPESSFGALLFSGILALSMCGQMRKSLV